MFTNGSTAIEGLSGSASGAASISGSLPTSLTSATKRKPLRATVRMSFCSWPLSPIAVRAALMWLVRVDSETMRPCQTASSRSSLLTTRSRFATRWSRTSNTCGPTGTGADARVSSRRSVSSMQSPNWSCIGGAPLPSLAGRALELYRPCLYNTETCEAISGRIFNANSSVIQGRSKAAVPAFVQSRTTDVRQREREPGMSTISTDDGTTIFYKDWSPEHAPKGTIVFHHGWPLSADDWDAQMLFFVGQGYRVIAHDRRGHGRSSQTPRGHDMDTYAADAAALVDHL